MENKDNSRRKFLLTALAAGVAAGCSSKKNPFIPEEQQLQASGEKVKLLSVDGEIIEMDKAFLKPVPYMPPVSNSEARKGIPGKNS